MSAQDEMQKEMATQKKEERIHEAERQKQEVYESNAAARQASYSTGEPHSYSTTGESGQHTGMHQMSALPGHGTGEPTGHVTEGVVGSHPIGTQRSSTADNRHVGGGAANAGGYGGTGGGI